MTQTLEPTTTAEPSAARRRVETWLADFEAALAARDAERAAGLFATTSFWRDLIAFTWNLTTVENRDGVEDLLRNTMETTDATNFRITDGEEPDEAGGVTTAWFRFETAVGRGSGLLRLNDEGAWTFLTTLDELKGHEENQGTTRPKGVEHGARKERVTWKERRAAEVDGFGRDRDPDVLVIGGGQGGIALGARLRQLGVDHLVVDRHARPGDQWRSRYKSLCLHDPVWYDHLPYLPFPRNWPVFAPKDKIGDWLEMYTRVMEINYWGSTTAKSATWDDAKKEWTVTVDRDGEEVVLHPKQLVFALGVSGKPNVPTIPGQDVFRGRAAPQLAAPGPGRLQGQEGRRHRVEQLGVRHLRGAVGGRRRRHDGAAQLHPHRQVGLADGHRPRRPVLRAGAGGRGDHVQGRHDLRLAAVPDHARVPDPAVPADGRARQGLLRAPGGVGLPARLGRRRVGPVHEVPAARLGLLHRRRRRATSSPTARSRSSTARSSS